MIVSGRPSPTRSIHLELVAPPITGNARTEVCIVGAGLAGMTAAYLLARAKRSVMVVDEGPIGGVPSSAEAAHLAAMLEHPYWILEKLHGAQAARIAAQSHAAAIDAIEATVRREHIACEFERLDGYRFSGAAQPRAEAEREVEAARRAGIGGAELAPGAPVEGEASAPCVHYPAQAHLHPLKYLAGLARAITRQGGRIHSGVRTRAIDAGRPSSLVTAAGHRIEAEVIVMPGGALPAPRPANVVGLRMPRGAVSRALYWESGDGLRCARLRTGTAAGEVLLVAGLDEPDALAGWARRRFPRAGEVVHRSAGEVMHTADLHAFVGHRERDAESVYVSTSSWGSAMTRAAIAGMVIRDFAEGSRSSRSDPTVPSACYGAKLVRGLREEA